MKKIIFMGTPEFAVPILEGLNSKGLEIVTVVTQPDQPVGRKRKITPPPVKVKAEELGLAVFQPESIAEPESVQKLRELDADLIITAAYGQILPTELLDYPTYGALNVHASLLPRYRGGAPIHHAVYCGDEKTGVTIIEMTERLDAGPMYAQSEIEIKSDDDTGTLFEKLSVLGRETLLEMLPAFFEGEITPINQNEEEAVYSPAITRAQEEISWKDSAEQIERHVRALRPEPGAYTILNGERIKIWKTDVSDKETETEPGTIVELTKKNIFVACGDQSVLMLREIQPAGKNAMPVANYLSGAGRDLEEGVVLGE